MNVVSPINIRLGGAAGKTLAALAIVGSLLAGCASLPDDSKEAKVTRFNNLKADGKKNCTYKP